MSNLRLTIIMFILAAALAPALIIGLGSWSDAAAGQRAPVHAGAPPIEAAVFKPVGLNQAPWMGSEKARDQPTDAAKPTDVKPAAGPKPVTVLELFTSEGCSSCPPADRLLASLAREHAKDPSVFLLAFHVDYWDYLGWKDPFASAEATSRQRAYGKILDGGKVYTPQLVVNGEKGFVGSDRDKTDAAISESQVRKAGGRAVVTGTRDEIKAGQDAVVECMVAGWAGAALPSKVRVVACLVEDGLVTRVKKGENEGRELKHERVVRAMAEAECSAGAKVSLKLSVPKDVKPGHCAVVVMVQDGSNMHVLGAAEIAPKVEAKVEAKP